jgi:hypothetical protein
MASPLLIAAIAFNNDPLNNPNPIWRSTACSEPMKKLVFRPLWKLREATSFAADDISGRGEGQAAGLEGLP